MPTERMPCRTLLNLSIARMSGRCDEGVAWSSAWSVLVSKTCSEDCRAGHSSRINDPHLSSSSACPSTGRYHTWYSHLRANRIGF
uniref:Secreted protein n=1 Tax=Haemonchus placei TaxID=6290 RepID=A0A0N4X8G2_HAEPC